jgi:hypothetical protein
VAGRLAGRDLVAGQVAAHSAEAHPLDGDRSFESPTHSLHAVETRW